MEWTRLERLRDLFLRGDKSQDYWRDDGDLAAYDEVFARRIGWKWDSVLRELVSRGYSPGPRHLIDWGCGSGAASRSWLENFAAEGWGAEFWDRSPLARSFASRSARSIEPTLAVSDCVRDPLFGENSKAPESVVLLSHVVNEIPPPELARLLLALGRAAEIIWVEPGSKEESRRLGEIRGKLLATHKVLGPCLHEERCPLLKDGREDDWCHSFSDPPTEAFTTGFWAEASRRLGFDVRSLPFCYIAMRRRDLADAAAREPTVTSGRAGRVLGTPRLSKGFARVQICFEDGKVEDLRLQKRSDKALFKAVEKGLEESPYLALVTEGDEVLSGRRLMDKDEAST